MAVLFVPAIATMPGLVSLGVLWIAIGWALFFLFYRSFTISDAWNKHHRQQTLNELFFQMSWWKRVIMVCIAVIGASYLGGVLALDVLRSHMLFGWLFLFGDSDGLFVLIQPVIIVLRLSLLPVMGIASFRMFQYGLTMLFLLRYTGWKQCIISIEIVLIAIARLAVSITTEIL